MASNEGDVLATEVAGIRLRSPVLLAAGTCGTLDEMAGAVDLSRVGGLVTKSITRAPREGNPTWRVVPTPTGMLNAVGLANPGVEKFAAEYGPRAGAVPCPVIGSVAGFSLEDYVAVAEAMEGIPEMAGVELNVSCPNVHGGCEFGADPRALAELVREVRGVVRTKPLFVKLSPVTVGTPATIVDLARAAIDPTPGPGGGASGGPGGRPGADGLVLCNTVPAMGIDVETRRPLLANVTGGLSGPAVHAIAVRMVHLVYRGIAKDAGVPLVGLGGVTGWRDAAEFVLAGASAVQMGTALFADPRAPVGVARGLAKWARRQGAQNVSELVGAVVLE